MSKVSIIPFMNENFHTQFDNFDMKPSIEVYDQLKEVEHQIFYRNKPDKKPTAQEPLNDRFNLVFFTFVLYGMAAILPWNVFVTTVEV